MTSIGLNDIAFGVKLAYNIWTLGFSQATSAQTQYADFGLEISNLHKNLQSLEAVVRRASQNASGRPPPLPLANSSFAPIDHQHLRTVAEICGDFHRTLQKCQKLLDDKSIFQKRDGFVRNVLWNVTVEPEVRLLRERVRSHNLKIITILQPLELTLVERLHHDVRAIGGHISYQLAELRDLFQYGQQRDIGAQNLRDDPRSPESSALPLPAGLMDRFDAAFDAAFQNLQGKYTDEKDLPLQNQISCFLYHFAVGTEGFSPLQGADTEAPIMQYLNLLKSIYILGKIKLSRDYTLRCKDKNDILWISYVGELERRCLRQSYRFKTQASPNERLTRPADSSVLNCPDEDFSFWLVDDEDEDEHAVGGPQREIMRAKLAISSPREEQELVLVRHSPEIIEMLLVHTRKDASQNRNTYSYSIDLRRARLLPLWAQTEEEVCNINFKGDTATDFALSFNALHDMLKFQQAITAFKVVLIQKQVRAVFCGSGKEARSHGKLQIWRERKIDAETRPGTVDEQAPLTSMSRRRSSQHSPCPPAFHRRTSIVSKASSHASSSDTFTSERTSHFEDGDAVGFSIDAPVPPMVIFLLSSEGVKSCDHYIAIKVDAETYLDNICTCKERAICGHIAMKRGKRGKPLLAQRLGLSSSDGRGPPNLAALGSYQNNARGILSPALHPMKNLDFVQISFRSTATKDAVPHKQDFMDALAGEKTIYENKMKYYKQNLADYRSRHT